MKTETKKKKWLKIAQQHQDLDMFIQGCWIDEEQKTKKGFKGCFFGCMTQAEDNTLNEASKVMELPLWLVHVSERIFEGLPEKKAIKFPVQLLEAISPKKDLEQSWKDFQYKLLMDKKRGQITFTEKDSEQYKAVIQCANLFKMDNIDEDAAESAAWSAARSAESAAESAAWSAAESAAWSAAESAAWSAARSAWSAAESAAWSAAESAARSAARSAESAARSAESAAWSAAESAESAARGSHYEWMRDLLIKCVG